MVGAGTAMLLLAAWALLAAWRGRIDVGRLLLTLLVPAIALPYISNSAGWIFTEIGRAPWIVFGLQRIADGVSKSVTAGELLFTLVGFTLLYGVLMAADVYLLAKYAKAGVTRVDLHGGEHPSAGPARN
jgi:cytochrome d ubiquinol oxidase subunit I